MTTQLDQRNVLLIGKSQLVLNDAIAELQSLGYSARATNDFFNITARFDPREMDLVVFGGQVPADRNAELRKEIAAINPSVIFVQGLAGIPGLIVTQVQGAFAIDHQDALAEPRLTPERSIAFRLQEPRMVKVTVWWQTSFVPPDPKSESLVLVDQRLDAGHHAIQVPDAIPPQAAFATVQINSATYAFSIALDGDKRRRRGRADHRARVNGQRQAAVPGPRFSGVLLRLARVTNPLALPLAGKRWNPIFAVVEHRGRKTGRRYAAPVAARRVRGGFVIALAFGAQVGWHRNLLAAHGGTIRWRGQAYRVGAPEPIDPAVGLAAFPPHSEGAAPDHRHRWLRERARRGLRHPNDVRCRCRARWTTTSARFAVGSRRRSASSRISS